MPYCQLYYHIVWTTKYREPVLTRKLEKTIYRLIRIKAEQLGARVITLNGWLDHVHLVVEIPARISVAEFVRQVKGYSSAMYNKENHPATPFYWQTEYGAFSFSKRNLYAVVRYVKGQKWRHRVDLDQLFEPLFTGFDDI